MRQYKKEITKSFNKMNANTQEELFIKMNNGDLNARDTLIKNCLPLVIEIAKKYSINNKHVDIEDMIQEGNLALIKAVDNWNIERGCITTVATWYIRNALNDLISDARYKIISPYTMSRSASEDLRKINKISSTDIFEISKLTKMKPRKVQRLINSKAARVDFKYMDDIIDEQNIARKCMLDLHDLCNSHLNGIDKSIFGLYIGSHGKRMKIREICSKLNMIEQDVRSIINRCKTKLKKVANA